MTRDKSTEHETKGQSLQALNDEVRPACAIITCAFACNAKVPETIRKLIGNKQASSGSAFLIAPELVATCAHVLDFLPNRSSFARMQGERQQFDGVNGTKVTLRFADKTVEHCVVFALEASDLAKDEPVYSLGKLLTSNKETYITTKYLAWLEERVNRTISLKFSARKAEIVLNVSADCFHTYSHDRYEYDEDRANALLRSADDGAILSPEKKDPVPLPLKAEVWCSNDHDCAVIQLDETKVLWDVNPIPLATGCTYEETVYLYGYPKDSKGFLRLKFEINDTHATEERSALIESIVPHNRFIKATSSQVTFGSNLHGCSGGPLVTEDGLCIGVQMSIMAVPSSTSGQFGVINAAPAAYLQRLLPFRLDLRYRQNKYVQVLSALKNKRKKKVLRPVVVGHADFLMHLTKLTMALEAAGPLGRPPWNSSLAHEFNSGLKNWRTALSSKDYVREERIKKELIEFIDHADFLVVCSGQPADSSGSAQALLQTLVTRCVQRCEQGEAVVIWCELAVDANLARLLDGCAIDASELQPIEDIGEFEKPEVLMAWTWVVHRIQMFLDYYAII